MLPERLKKYAEPIPVLNHGFVQLVDLMGDDAAVLQAARTSMASSPGTPAEDEKLLRYLFRHKHATPFEACNIKLIVKLPIFVERQWVRHRASWLNEVSARYTQLPAEFYIPDLARIQRQSKSNKQGSGAPFDEENQRAFQMDFENEATETLELYDQKVKDGMAKELARINLPVGVYTQKIWGSSLRMVLHFLGLRADPHAQWEIRQYAEVVCEILEAWCPWTYQAFLDYELNAHTFSAQEVAAIRLLMSYGQREYPIPVNTKDLRKQFADINKLGSGRERKAFWDKLGLLEAT